MISTQIQSPWCDVCHGAYDISEANLTLDLCSEHNDSLVQSIAAKMLRQTIPPDFHYAQPKDLPPTIRKFNIEENGGKGMYFYGDVGAGKSHAAAAFLKRAFMDQVKQHRFPSTIWMNVPTAIVDTLADFQARRNASRRWDDAQNADLLVLDDIGFEAPKEWIRTRLYTLLEHRLQYAKPTIVTSNLNPTQLAERMSAPQIASRLSQMCVQFEFSGQDRRPHIETATASLLNEGETSKPNGGRI